MAHVIHISSPLYKSILGEITVANCWAMNDSRDHVSKIEVMRSPALWPGADYKIQLSNGLKYITPIVYV